VLEGAVHRALDRPLVEVSERKRAVEGAVHRAFDRALASKAA
jgi:hypothetical protein